MRAKARRRSDLGEDYAEQKVKDISRALDRTYKKAQQDIQKTIANYTERTAEREKLYLAKVKAGDMTQEEFDNWKRNRAFYGDSWKTQEKNIANILYDTNKVVNDIVRGEQFNVFAFNANYAAYNIEKDIGATVGFDIYSKETVQKLIIDKPNILPFKKLEKGKDVRWNFNNIRSEIAQGVIQGKSIPKIAESLANVVPNRNKKQMVLHARTAMTSAQNGGRMERFKEAEDMGIEMQKVWIATLDDRTRETHQELDGQAVDLEEDFEVEGMRIRYPGDPWADPSLTYNCRCTLGEKLKKYPASFTRRAKDPESGYEIISGNITYKEWAKSKEKDDG